MPAHLLSNQNDSLAEVDFYTCVNQLNGNEISEEVRKKRITQFIREAGVKDSNYCLQILCQNPRNVTHIDLIRDEFLRNVNLSDAQSKMTFVNVIKENQGHKSPPIGFICVQILLALGEQPWDGIMESTSLDKDTLMGRIKSSQSTRFDEVACCSPKLGLTLLELLSALKTFYIESKQWYFFPWSYVLASKGYNRVNELCDALTIEAEWHNQFILSALTQIRAPIPAKKIAPFLSTQDHDDPALLLLRDYGGQEATRYLYNFVIKEIDNLSVPIIGGYLFALAAKGDDGVKLIENLVQHPSPKIWEALMYEKEIETVRRLIAGEGTNI